MPSATKLRDFHVQAVHAAAFQGALARPLACPRDAVPYLTADKLRQFFKDNYTGNRMVIAGAGVSHQELVPLVEPLVANLPSGGKPNEPASKYLGGDYR